MSKTLLSLAFACTLIGNVLSFNVNDTANALNDRNFPATASVNYAQGPGYTTYNQQPSNGYYIQQNQYPNRQGCMNTG